MGECGLENSAGLAKATGSVIAKAVFMTMGKDSVFLYLKSKEKVSIPWKLKNIATNLNMSSHASLFLPKLCFLFLCQDIPMQKVYISLKIEICCKTEITRHTHICIHIYIHCYLTGGCSTFLLAATYLLNTTDMFVKQILILNFVLE